MAQDKRIQQITPADLPAPPKAAMQIMRACSKKTVNNKELSQLTANDPLLTAELLRVVNSSFFGMGGNIQSINRAILVLGQRALRNMALCLSVRDALKAKPIKGFDLTMFWEDGLRRAVSARLLGELVNLNPDDCFTAGLLQDFGMLVLFYLHPEKVSFWASMRSLDPEARLLEEEKIFGTTHDQVVAMLAKAWHLPVDLGRVLAEHHHADRAETSRLSDILHCADWLNAIYSAAEKGMVLDRCRKLLADHFTISPEDGEVYMAVIPSKVEEAAQALGLRVGEQSDFNEVIRQANLQLIQDNLTYQELAWRLKKVLRDRDRLAEELQRELRLAREVQQSLLPREMAKDFPVYGINVPAGKLSGDFFDYFFLADGRIYFNLGDVSGKGTNASLLMAKVISIFRCLGKEIHDPAKLFAVINNELCATSVRGMFVTMAAGLLDPATGAIELVNAGHPPTLLVDATGKVRQLAAEAPPLGIMPGQIYSVNRFLLAKSRLFLYSDGVIEGSIQPDKPLGVKGLCRLLGASQKLQPQECIQRIVEKIRTVTSPLKDDVTMLVVEGRK
ncbi:MAG: HDOD domain-containing protein [Desulfobulbaceae bacterium]|nr:HDOD domain-containing protein [Desulfobulbaceae bacterium]